MNSLERTVFITNLMRRADYEKSGYIYDPNFCIESDRADGHKPNLKLIIVVSCLAVGTLAVIGSIYIIYKRHYFKK